MQGENQLFLNGFGKADSANENCNILQLQSATSKLESTSESTPGSSAPNKAELSVASVEVKFDDELKGMIFDLSDGSFLAIGEGGSELTNTERVEFKLPYQSLIGFSALLNSENKVESLSVIKFDCVTGPDGLLTRW